MFPANEMFYSAEVAYRQERAMKAFGPRRRRRIRLSTFPRIRPLSHLTHKASDFVRAA